jgi:NADH dehydrogenase
VSKLPSGDFRPADRSIKQEQRVILITGANGNLGRRLLKVLTDQDRSVRAVVRSERAAAQIRGMQLRQEPEIVQLDYLDAAAMRAAMQGARAIVHLVGIIKETAASSYLDAHEGTTRVVVEQAAAAGVERVIYLSIVGTSPDSANDCLRSKAAAENILLAGSVPALVLRVPMVLGEGDYASAALKNRAMRSTNFLLRGSSLEQPIYAGDVVAAIVRGLSCETPLDQGLDLAGPQSLSRAELTQAAARSLGNTTRTISLPLFLGLLMAWIFERVSGSPPVTRAMLGVLDHDDQLDVSATLALLELELTPLQSMLELCVAGKTPD